MYKSINFKYNSCLLLNSLVLQKRLFILFLGVKLNYKQEGKTVFGPKLKSSSMKELGFILKINTKFDVDVMYSSIIFQGNL